MSKGNSEWDLACSDLIGLLEKIGINIPGWAPNDQFEEVVLENQRLIQTFAGDFRGRRIGKECEIVHRHPRKSI
jgi:hypothetical protein